MNKEDLFLIRDLFFFPRKPKTMIPQFPKYGSRPVTFNRSRQASEQSSMPSQQGPVPITFKGTQYPDEFPPMPVYSEPSPPSPLITLAPDGTVQDVPKNSNYLCAPSKIVGQGVGPYPSATEDNIVIPGSMDERGNLWAVLDRPRHSWFESARTTAINQALHLDVPAFGAAGVTTVLENFFVSMHGNGSLTPHQVPVHIELYDGLTADPDRLTIFSLWAGPLAYIDPNANTIGITMGGNVYVINLTKLNIAGLRTNRGMSLSLPPQSEVYWSTIMSGWYAQDEIPPVAA